MLGKVKDFLGIEGVRVALTVDEPVRLRAGLLTGRVELSSLSAKTITDLRLRFEERYQRGWGSDKLIDVYTLGEHREALELHVAARETVELPFTLPFGARRTPVDRWTDRSVFLKPLGALARLSAGAKSTYTLHAQARVKGVALGPEAQITLDLS